MPRAHEPQTRHFTVVKTAYEEDFMAQVDDLIAKGWTPMGQPRWIKQGKYNSHDGLGKPIKVKAPDLLTLYLYKKR